MTNKTRKSSKKAPVAAAVEAALPARDDAAHMTERAALLRDVAAKREADRAEAAAPDESEKLRLGALNASHRADRADRFGKMFNGNKSHAEKFAEIADTDVRLAEFDASAIYMQDKVRDLIRALADGTAAGNKMTKQTLRTVIAAGERGATRADVIAELQTECGVTSGTAGSQSSSSLIALNFCRIIASSGAGRFARYTVRPEAEELAAVIVG